MDGLRSREFGASADAGWSGPRPVRSWLPDEAPLDMPRQGLADVGAPPPIQTAPGLGLRRTVMLLATLSLALFAFLTPARVYAEDGFTALEILALCLFSASSCRWCAATATTLTSRIVRGGRRSAPRF
jgi:membrane glycosyltransferase